MERTNKNFSLFFMSLEQDIANVCESVAEAVQGRLRAIRMSGQFLDELH